MDLENIGGPVGGQYWYSETFGVAYRVIQKRQNLFSNFQISKIPTKNSKILFFRSKLIQVCKNFSKILIQPRAGRTGGGGRGPGAGGLGPPMFLNSNTGPLTNPPLFSRFISDGPSKKCTFCPPCKVDDAPEVASGYDHIT